MGAEECQRDDGLGVPDVPTGFETKCLVEGNRYQFEVFVFVGAVFFVLSYALSQASYRLEEELGAGDR